MWQQRLGDAPSYQQRIRFGLLLLAMDSKAPASAFERLATPSGEEEQIIVRIIEAGKAIASSADPTEALIGLLDTGHVKSVDWALDYLEQLPDQQRACVY